MSKHNGIIHENSHSRVLWDILVLILIIVSLVLIPFELAFQHSINPITNWIIYTVDFVLIFDIFLNFRTSYTRKGISYKDRKSIGKHYTKTFLIYDLLANIPFEFIFLWTDVTLLNEPIALVLRCLSFFRIARLNLIFNRWMRFSRFKVGYMRIAKFFVVISLFIHVISCSWYFTAYETGFPEDSWVVRQGIDPQDSGTSYIRALYWAVTTMTTIGYGDITPERNLEIVFVIIVMLLGASMYAYIIGNIASLVSNIDAVRSQYYNKVEMLNSYLINRETPAETVRELNAYHDYVWARHGGHGADDLLEELPKPLRTSLMQHLAKDLLEKIPLFELSSTQLREELLASLRNITYPPGYYIRRENSFGDNIYFISEGEVEIIKESEDKSYGNLESGDYFGYMSFILHEKSTVSLRTNTYCDLFVLNKSDYDRLMEHYPEFQKLLKNVSAEKSDRASEWLMDGIII